MSVSLFDVDGNVVASEGGVFHVNDLATYTLKSDSQLTELQPHVQHLPGLEGRVATVCFENFVGRAEVGALRFEVAHSKLREESFSSMLDTVIERTHELVFGFESPTGFGASSHEHGSAIPFHSLAYLRHMMIRLQGGEGLLGQFLQIARHPHRKIRVDPSWVSVAHAARVSPAGLRAVASHPERLQRIHAAHPLVATSLGRALHCEPDVWRFPSEILSSRREESFDTHENRLVKAFLREAREVVARFEGQLRNPVLAEELVRMKGELEWMGSHDFLSEVGELTVFPAQSTVLHGRAGYKEVFQHWLSLRAGAALNDDELWGRLLDAKDCATLYELWSFFKVKEALEDELGISSRVEVTADDTSAKVPWGASVSWDNGRVTLTFNRSYAGNRPRRSGPQASATSYSVALRPDLTLHVKRAGGTVEALVLDAKFKFSGERLAGIETADGSVAAADSNETGDSEPEPIRRAVVADLHKMHAYRDALSDVVGAFVLFPGNDGRSFRAEQGGREVDGIGAVPLVPGGDDSALEKLLVGFVC